MTCPGSEGGQRGNARIKFGTICEAKDRLMESIEVTKIYLQMPLNQEPPESLSLETEIQIPLSQGYGFCMAASYLEITA